VKLLRTPALRSSVEALAQGTTADRDNIPRLGAAHDIGSAIGARGGRGNPT
jgi:hypothetical protein